MKNNRGFTLVELLAVIAILAIIAVATFETIDSVNKGNKEKAEKVHTQNILNSAVAYVPTSEVVLPNCIEVSGCNTYNYKKTGLTKSNSSTEICIVKVYLSKLVDEGILDDNLKNPLTGSLLNMDESYVQINFITSANKPVEGTVGKYDGSYFYRVVEVPK